MLTKGTECREQILKLETLFLYADIGDLNAYGSVVEYMSVIYGYPKGM